jgi:hypothetical protein
MTHQHFIEPTDIRVALPELIRKAGRDPDTAWVTFDAMDSLLIAEGHRPTARGQMYLVLFHDWTFVKVDVSPAPAGQ